MSGQRAAGGGRWEARSEKREARSSKLEVAVIGSGTGVGKTHATILLVRGLRLLGRRVWVHKPIACGGWREATAEDGRALAALRAGDQPRATICPLQFREAASPHLAARAAGARVTLAALRANLRRCRGDHDLVVEGAGGLLSPLTARREGIADLVAGGLPAVIVTRPDLGTLNHTALTVAEARRRGLRLLGLVLCHVARPARSLAVRTAAVELAALCRLPVIAEVAHGADSAAAARQLATRVLRASGSLR